MLQQQFAKKTFSVLTLLSTKLYPLVPNSFEKLMKLILLERHVDDLHSGEITNFQKFLQKLLSRVIK